MPDSLMALLTGAGLGASLIIAIGAQNAYLLGQAIRGQHAILIATICAFIDAFLIVVGIAGVGTFLAQSPRLLWLITVGGSLFLFVYGWMAFRRALEPTALAASTDPPMADRREVILTTLALSLLNPHVYLDTVLLLGSIGARQPGDGPVWFGIGAVMASFTWFFSLALAGRWLSRWLRDPRHWQKLDMLIGLIMWSIAISLSRSL